MPDWACWVGFRPERPGGRGLISAPGATATAACCTSTRSPSARAWGCGAGLQIGGQPGGFGAVRVSASPWPPLAALCCLAWLERQGRQNAPCGVLCGSAVAARLLCGAEQLGPFDGSQPGAPGPAGYCRCPAAWAICPPPRPGAEQAVLTACRAMGGVGCLYFLSLTTPMHEIMEALRRLRVPQAVIELMVLVYRVPVRAAGQAAAPQHGGRRPPGLPGPGPVAAHLMAKSPPACWPTPSAGLPSAMTPWRPGATMARCGF